MYYPGIFLIIINILFFTACSPQYSGKKAPKVTSAILDLRDWNFEKDGSVEVGKKWVEISVN